MKFIREQLDVPQADDKGRMDLKPLVDRLNKQLDHFEKLFTQLSVTDNLRMEFREFTWTDGNEPFRIVPRMPANAVKAVLVCQLLNDDFTSVASLGAVGVNWHLSDDGLAIEIEEIAGFSGSADFFIRLLLVGE